MTQPKGRYTIAEAAELWISLIQSPETKATPEQKDALIAQIRAAAPSTKIIGVAGTIAGAAVAHERMDFCSACNNIKRTIREGK